MPELRATKDMGYIAIPGYSGTSPAAGRAYALRMFAALRQVPAARCGWIIDLRTNSGGNMYPMLNGLEPFLGNQTLGYFIRPPAKIAWPARHSLPMAPPPHLMPLGSAWVAVITGPRTASSGEVVAMAFRGRPHTRSFGQPTAGLTTGNEIFKLSDGSSIALTTSVEADRTGRVYGGKLDPDEVVDDPAVIEAAGKWLRDSSGCGVQ